MTATRFSFMFSVCFVTLLIWARCTTVVCLVNEKSLVGPTTTTGYHSTETTNANGTVLDLPLSFACGNNSQNCKVFCDICESYPFSTMDCLSQMFQHLCLSNFDNAMNSLNSTDWCIWGNVSGLYSNLSLCTEEISDCLLIPWPNPLVEQTFVNLHTKYFSACPTEELSDPQPVIVFALVITPICLIPVMVSLVVLKTKNGDGSS